MNAAVLRPGFASQGKDGWRLSVWVQPGAKATELAGEHGGCLKIRLQAPAVDNRANKALIEFVARLSGLKMQQVTLESGHGSRQKKVLLHTKEEPDWKMFSLRD
jgi:uncharacterized protein (TIGR00251 family)